MKYILALAFLLFCLCKSVMAQDAPLHDYQSSLGLTYQVGFTDVTSSGIYQYNGSAYKVTYNLAYGGFGLSFWPRYNLFQKHNKSIDLGSPMSFCINDNQEEWVPYYLNLPLAFDFNLGRGSTEMCENNVGVYVGLGLTYFRGSSAVVDHQGTSYSAPTAITINGAAPLFHTGFRVVSGEEYTDFKFHVILSKPVIFGFTASLGLN